MPRRGLTFVQGHYYHLYNRGANRQPIFVESENYLFLLRLLKAYTSRFCLSVIAYCLMPNHYHLLVRQDADQPAGRLPAAVFNSYTKALNKRCGRTGALFEGRYRAVDVDREEYLLHLCRYIHGNPVKGGLVEHVEAWPYSNYHEWVGARTGALVDREFMCTWFPGAGRYARFVRDYLSGRDGLPIGIEGYTIE